MGITKTDLFSQEQNELAQIAKALAHPARIAILQHLIKEKVCINSTLVQELGLAQATISQHLRELKELGLIQGTIEGVSISYCINPKKWEEVQGLFNGLFEQLDNACDPRICC
jgi:predicted transcriptional regulator